MPLPEPILSDTIPGPGPTLVALGGNALIRAGEAGTVPEQARRVAEVARGLAAMDAPGGLIVTHGNGPQVGRHLLRSDLVGDQVPPIPLDIAVAATQGEIGWLIQQALTNALAALDDPRPAVTLLTQVVVDPKDPAFDNPTKFIGSYWDEETALIRASQLGWHVRKDGHRGWRRVVPSPHPLEIVEASQVWDLSQRGAIVIACGGGGIPVIRVGNQLAGVEAVVDKDRASALLATVLGVRRMIILTAVDQIWLDFQSPDGRPLGTVQAPELHAHLEAGHFPPGSMRPKVEAALAFLANGGHEVVITSPEHLSGVDRGGPCTRVVRGV